MLRIFFFFFSFMEEEKGLRNFYIPKLQLFLKIEIKLMIFLVSFVPFSLPANLTLACGTLHVRLHLC